MIKIDPGYKERKRVYGQLWREANKEKINIYRRAWRESNRDKDNESARKRYSINPDRIRGHSNKWKKGHPDLLRVYRKNYYLNNKEKADNSKRRWLAANPGLANEMKSNWRKNNPGKSMVSNAKYRASRINASPPWLTREHFRQIESFYLNAKKLTEGTGVRYSVDHIWPLCGKGFTGLHVPWNLRVMPLRENIKKSNKTVLIGGDSNKYL